MNAKSKKPFRNLLEAPRLHARVQPEKRAYTFLVDGETEEIHLSYAELDRKARRIAAKLQSLGAQGERALLLYAPGLDYIVAFYGCLYAGVIAVPVYPPDPSRLARTLPRLQAITQDAQARFALTTQSILGFTGGLFEFEPDLQSLEWLATDEQMPGLEDEWQESLIEPDTLAFLQYTSGSTGNPKGVMLSHSNLLANQEMITEGFGLDSETIGFGWLPFYHDMGLIGNILEPMHLGIPCILMSPLSFLQHPMRWLRGISRFQATTSGGPNFAYDLCARKFRAEEGKDLDLSSWKVAFCGAEPIRKETLDRFEQTFSPYGFRKQAFYPCYGLAEGTLIVTGGLASEPPTVEHLSSELLKQRCVEAVPEGHPGKQSLIGCGRALGKEKVRIVDPESRIPCPAGRIGEIWICGPNVAKGYWKKPEMTREVFQAVLPSEECPFLRTGDLGFVKDGELFIAGRLKDLIIIRGRNHFPQDLELTVEKSDPRLKAGCGAAFTIDLHGEEQLVIVQEVDTDLIPDLKALLKTIRREISQKHDLKTHAIALIRSKAIPKTSSGKIQRFACREAFLNRTLEVVAEEREALSPPTQHAGLSSTLFQENAQKPPFSLGSKEEIQGGLIQLLARRLGLEPNVMDPRQSFFSYGLDSLELVELSGELEKHLHSSFCPTLLWKYPTIETLACALSKLSPVARKEQSPEKNPLSAEGEFSLSSNQRALWWIHQIDPQTSSYNIVRAIEISGPLNIPALKNCFQRAIDRHPALRAQFLAREEGPLQRIRPQLSLSFEEIDARNWSEEILQERLFAEGYRPFDLEKDALLRVHLFRNAQQGNLLLVSIHHIICDFYSLALLMREIQTLYSAGEEISLAALPSVNGHYQGYSEQEARELEGTRGEEDRAYWSEKLSDKARPKWKTDYVSSLSRKDESALLSFFLPKPLVQMLKDYSRRHGSTLFVTLLAAYKTVLKEWNGGEDVIVGTLLSNRKSEFSNQVGLYANVLPLRTSLSGSSSFSETLHRVSQTVREAIEHQSYPYALIASEIEPGKDPRDASLFKTIFNFLQTPAFDGENFAAFALCEPGASFSLGKGVTLKPYPLRDQRVNADFALTLAESENGMRIQFNYNKALFRESTLEKILGDYQRVLEEVHL